MSQSSFASLAYDRKKKVTRREKFLNEMSSVIPWRRLESVVSPHYPDQGNGRPPIGVGRMLRIYFLQQWFNLSDPGMEDALYDSESMRRFTGIELGVDAVPDETTICKFRHLLERHELTKLLFEEANEYLGEKGFLLKQGTIVDATIVDAPVSTKNKSKTRDPEMRQVKKGNEWYFGMKAHIGTDKSGFVHSLKCTSANEHDGKHINDLLHGEESEVYGDSAYYSKKRREEFEEQGIKFKVKKQARRDHPLSKREINRNRKISRVRAFVEHPFGVVKYTWGHSKVRYRGIKKNLAHFHTLFALANIFRARRKILKFAK